MSITSNWKKFITELPHQELPYSKKNWGNANHSLCSYQGKLKPAIAHHLVTIFTNPGDKIFDPFAGVGTIPFEAALNGRISFGIDISPLAHIVSNAKLHKHDHALCMEYLKQLEEYITSTDLDDEYTRKHAGFGFNKTLQDYYDPQTFAEILKARKFIGEYYPDTPDKQLVIASLLHILHGNRPYALSRKSHPIVPYAPTGDFIYKNLIEKVSEKLTKSLNVELPNNFTEGEIYLGDSTKEWNDSICDIDAIITSPPFFDSTRFHLANWIRLWFMGWDSEEFNTEPQKYVDERQKKDFDLYNSIFQQATERLVTGGHFVMHLGKSKKCDMGEVLKSIAKPYFKSVKLYSESVTHCDKFGIKDLGTVTSHQYLIMH